MAKEKVLSEVLNLRIDEALARELKRIAAERRSSESETARVLLAWGVQVARAAQADELRKPYDAPSSGDAVRLVIDARWQEYDPADEDWR